MSFAAAGPTQDIPGICDLSACSIELNFKQLSIVIRSLSGKLCTLVTFSHVGHMIKSG